MASALILKLLSVLVVLVLITAAVYSKPVKGGFEPHTSWNENVSDDECKTKEDVQALCQRCAKSTKSNIVYPMCCTNKDEARTWCNSYLNFGIH